VPEEATLGWADTNSPEFVVRSPEACRSAVSVRRSGVLAHDTGAHWCSGQDELGPPGVSQEGSKNFAQPVNAARIVVVVVDDDAETITITSAYDHPVVKVRSTGQNTGLALTRTPVIRCCST
jgi:hypothetical protein